METEEQWNKKCVKCNWQRNGLSGKTRRKNLLIAKIQKTIWWRSEKCSKVSSRKQPKLIFNSSYCNLTSESVFWFRLAHLLQAVTRPLERVQNLGKFRFTVNFILSPLPPNLPFTFRLRWDKLSSWPLYPRFLIFSPPPKKNVIKSRSWKSNEAKTLSRGRNFFYDEQEKQKKSYEMI